MYQFSKFIFIMIALFLFQCSENKQTQTPSKKSISSDEKCISPQPAYFIGGEKAFVKFLTDRLVYPAKALDKGIEGVVYVRFTIDENGKINKDCVKVAKSVDYLLDKEAIRVVKLSPNWKPALCNNIPTKQKMRVPVKFRIETDSFLDLFW